MTAATILDPARELRVREECDVLVAGAGTAGCAAAIAAAREGARTVLVEQLPLPSGTMTNGGIIANSFYSSRTDKRPLPKRVVAGIPQEIFGRVIAAGGCPGYIKVDESVNPYRRPYIVISDPEVYKDVVGTMLLEAGVKVYLHTFLSGVHTEDGAPAAAIIESKSGREAIRAKQFVDCTGDGDLALAAGAETLPLHESFGGNPFLSNVGKMFGIANVDLDRFMEFAREDGIVHEEIHGGKFSADETYVRLMIGFASGKKTGEAAREAGFHGALFLSIHAGSIDFVNGIGEKTTNITDIEDFTRCELAMQSQMIKFMDFLRAHIPGFEYAYVSRSANQLGIRASRAVRCEYSLSVTELTHSARFEDEIGAFGFHDMSPVDEECVMLEEGLYGLPYRMILPVGAENLLVAGRMTSEDVKAHMSTRSTMCCMVQGQAAGTAAALCAKYGISPRTLEYPVLRAALEKAGVYFEPPAHS